MNPTPTQQAAIDSKDTLNVVVAGPGSGKSSTLIARIVRLIDAGTSPDEIVAITFTNAAARDMESRLKKKLAYCGTLHGFLLRLIQKHGEAIGFTGPVTIYDEEQVKELIERIVKEHRWKGSADAVTEALKIGPDYGGRTALDLIRRDYYQRLLARNSLDFDAILHYGLKLIQKLDFITSGVKHLFVDEFQDSSVLDAQIYRAMRMQNKFFVGDIDQCQPSSTLITLPDGNCCPISEIKEGDSIVSYERHGKTLIKDATVKKVASRLFNGNLFTVDCGGFKTQCTPNHKWLVRWSTGAERKVNLWCVYLMRKGDKFRIGKTMFFRSSGANGGIIGLGLRLRQERADCGWVLSIHKTDAEAIAQEQIISATYGLPQVTFVAANNTCHLTQTLLDEIYNRIPNQFLNANRCLQDHGREMGFPLLNLRDKRTRRTVQEIQSCNLISDVMQLPVAGFGYDSKKRNCKWMPLKVSYGHWRGMVYSLDVEKHHKYVSDGIVTCNSIYAFRGGNPELMLDLLYGAEGTKFVLVENFRCDRDICKAANNLIAHNVKRFDKTTQPVSRNAGSCEVFGYETPIQEMSTIAFRIQQSSPDETTAILTRSNAQANEIASFIEGIGIKVARKTRMQFPSGWQSCRALLAVLTNPDNDDLAYRFIKAHVSEIQANQLKMKALERFCSINSLAFQFLPGTPMSVLPQLLTDARIDAQAIAFVKEGIARLDDPNTATVGELIYTLSLDETRDFEQGSGVVVCTIHQAKGREWDTVYLPGWERNMIPVGKADIEEERRLAFVAITRAKHRVEISHCRRRARQWQKDDAALPSQFLQEIL